MTTKPVALTEDKRKYLKGKVAEVLAAGKTNWCVACGAGAKALKEMLVTKPDFFREVITEEAITTSLAKINMEEIKGKTNWCVACGAGASSPSAVSLPDVSLDKVMNEVVKVLGR